MKTDSKQVRVRFAPSPTGYLHVGGARTAIFNWLLAEKAGGVFMIRMEDTDRQRSADEFRDEIIQSLSWLGLESKEPVVYQSRRLSVYRKALESLLENGNAYRCFCSREALENDRKKAVAEKRSWRYPATCRKISRADSDQRAADGEPFTVRLKVDPGEIVFQDSIHGVVTFNAVNLDDFIIWRTDGTPVYNFAVVIDDSDMGITDVIRGDDHLSNTPRQLLLYRAMGRTAPIFAHVPMIVGTDRKKLSKRHGSTQVREFRNAGYLPEAMFNYLVRLGWAYDDSQEIFSRDELIEKFSQSRIVKTAAMFDFDKLESINLHWMKQRPIEDRVELCMNALVREGLVSPDDEKARRLLFEKVVPLAGERLKKGDDILKQADYFFRDVPCYEDRAVGKVDRPETPGIVLAAIALFKKADTFDRDFLQTAVYGLAEETGVKMKKVAMPLRVALTGRTFSPGLFEIMEIMGREKVVALLEKFAAVLEEKRSTED